MAVSWEQLARFVTSTFPETEESTSYGTPSLKVRGKLICRLRTESSGDGSLAIKCSLADKQALVEGDDPAYYTIPHYDGYAYILVDLDRADETEVRELLTEAWLLTAPVRVRRAWENQA